MRDLSLDFKHSAGDYKLLQKIQNVTDIVHSSQHHFP
ncbi:hypothetical protein NIES25_04840 [Nostoc linckia NIES-25]|nr:hypothetical protein NIES25_04840 [Nostoc linckia NIES-25]